MIRNDDKETMTVEIPKGQGLVSAEEGHKLLAQAFYFGFLFGYDPATSNPLRSLIEGIEDGNECAELMFAAYMKFSKAMEMRFFNGNLDNPVDRAVMEMYENLKEAQD